MAERPLHKSLQEIENVDEGDPEAASFPLVRRCLALRRVPVDELTHEGLRDLLGQKIGVPALAPIALALIEQNPFLDAELYPGALMLALMNAVANYWYDAPEIRRRLVAVIENMRALRRRHRELVEQGLPGFEIDAHALREADRWVAQPDTRSASQRRKDAEIFSEGWLALGGDSRFLKPAP
jgi:hypothetical protein